MSLALLLLVLASLSVSTLACSSTAKDSAAKVQARSRSEHGAWRLEQLLGRELP
ncbi:MAG TPA: hypothetical protein VIJ50_07985 [Solirubrobacteraceae bacterium]